MTRLHFAPMTIFCVWRWFSYLLLPVRPEFAESGVAYILQDEKQILLQWKTSFEFSKSPAMIHTLRWFYLAGTQLPIDPPSEQDVEEFREARDKCHWRDIKHQHGSCWERPRSQTRKKDTKAEIPSHLNWQWPWHRPLQRSKCPKTCRRSPFWRFLPVIQSILLDGDQPAEAWRQKLKSYTPMPAQTKDDILDVFLWKWQKWKVFKAIWLDEEAWPTTWPTHLPICSWIW